MDLLLNRYPINPTYGTFGKLSTIGGADLCRTVEQPWRDNQPFKSCVPVGEYLLARYSSPKFGRTWVLINESLGIFRVQHATGRYACLIHWGNWPTSVEGCIAVGANVTSVLGRLGVDQSTATFDRLLKVLDVAEFHNLTIKNAT